MRNLDWFCIKETAKDIIAVALIIGTVLGLFTLVLSAIIHDDSKIAVEWDKQDMIINEQFVTSFENCTDKFDRSTGLEFRDCLISSYNKAKLDSEE